MHIQGLSKIQCTKYSDLDDLVIYKASALGLPLIGGTALEVLSSYYGAPGVRKRSDNDLDFISGSLPTIKEFQHWCKNNTDPDKVKVDVMYVGSHDITKYQFDIHGVLVMKPQYILWSKLTRGNERDLKDIKWLMTIPELLDSDISNALDDLGVTAEEFSLLQSLLR